MEKENPPRKKNNKNLEELGAKVQNILYDIVVHVFYMMEYF